MHYPATTKQTTRTEYYVLWPLGVVGWRRCSQRMYQRILSRPETYSGVKVMRIEGAAR